MNEALKVRLDQWTMQKGLSISENKCKSDSRGPGKASILDELQTGFLVL